MLPWGVLGAGQVSVGVPGQDLRPGLGEGGCLSCFSWATGSVLEVWGVGRAWPWPLGPTDLRQRVHVPCYAFSGVRRPSER